jgi:hypothetical protein
MRRQRHQRVRGNAQCETLGHRRHRLVHGEQHQRPGSWPSAGGRWLLWTLRIVLWTTLLVIAFRGITAIISSSSRRRRAGTRPGTGGKFLVSLAEAYAIEFGWVYLGFSPQNLAQNQLMNELPAFFQAYASGDSAALNRFLAWRLGHQAGAAR